MIYKDKDIYIDDISKREKVKVNLYWSRIDQLYIEKENKIK